MRSCPLLEEPVSSVEDCQHHYDLNHVGNRHIRLQDLGTLSPLPQLFQPLFDLNPARFADIAMVTIRAVDSQERKQVAGPASQVHKHLVQMFRKRDT
jgi:hypothetical protein